MADQNELWPLPHNWADDWAESYEFKTEIIDSRDDTEQRRALRALPRVVYQFTSSPLDSRGVTALTRLSARHRKTWTVPHARFKTGLTSTITAGSNAFTLDADEPWCAIGRDLIFVRPDRTMEWGRIATYSLGAGTLEDTVLADIPAGSAVHHGIRGRFTGKSSIRMATTTIGSFSAEFIAEPGEVFRPDYGSDAETYNSRPVFTVRPNWAAPPTLEWDQVQDIIDMGFGVRGYVDPVDFVKRFVRCDFLLKDQTTQDELYGFFCRRYGQRESFYMPSWIKEFDPVAVTTGTLTVAGAGVAELYATDPVHRHITILRPGNVRDYVGVASVADVSGDSEITFDASIPAVTLDDIKFASWLLPCRFATDRAEINWSTKTIATVTLPVSTVRDE